MTNDAEIREKFWKHLKSERTIMIRLINDPSATLSR